jgi:hypothetical protein
MTNLTLSVDDETLQRAREAAVREHTSVNALVRDFLARYADTRERRLEALDILDSLADRRTAASAADWTRESLHERER